MQTIRNWTAKRSGASITITGTTYEGEAVTITGVQSIHPGTPWCYAVDKDGKRHVLDTVAVKQPA